MKAQKNTQSTTNPEGATMYIIGTLIHILSLLNVSRDNRFYFTVDGKVKYVKKGAVMNVTPKVTLATAQQVLDSVQNWVQSDILERGHELRDMRSNLTNEEFAEAMDELKREIKWERDSATTFLTTGTIPEEMMENGLYTEAYIKYLAAELLFTYGEIENAVIELMNADKEEEVKVVKTTGVKCGHCKEYHPTVADVRKCYGAPERVQKVLSEKKSAYVASGWQTKFFGTMAEAVQFAKALNTENLATQVKVSRSNNKEHTPYVSWLHTNQENSAS